MYIGIDLGGTNIAAGLVDKYGKIVASKSCPTGASRSAEEIIADMAALARGLVADNGMKETDIEWVGIGSPGTVNSKEGIIVYANNINFLNTPMRELFRQDFDIPVFVGNDADCAALGEAYFGAARGCEHSVMITLGTGLGGGIIIDRKVYSGFNGAGGELGHMCIVKDGVPCTCGRKGCWECYSSATALIRMTAEAMKADTEYSSLLWTMHDNKIENISGKSAFKAAAAGDKIAQKVVDGYIAYLACGIVNTINIFQPQILCIGGGISYERDNLLVPLKERVFAETYTHGDMPQTELKIAELGNNAGIIGAAMLGM